MEPPISLHSHRLTNSSSKLPTFRHADLAKSPDAGAQQQGLGLGLPSLWPSFSTANTTFQPTSNPYENVNHQTGHHRSDSDSSANISAPPKPASTQERSLVTSLASTSPADPLEPQQHQHQHQQQPQINSEDGASTTTSQNHPPFTRRNTRKIPGNGYLGKGPPPAMLTQKSLLQSVETEDPTKDWVVNQSTLTATSPIDQRKSVPQSPHSQPVTPSTPLIPPIRGFKSSRKSVDVPRSAAMEQDETLKVLDGFNSRRPSYINREQEEQSSDDSDLFLKLAREEAGNTRAGPIRRSQITSNRQSLPPNHTVFQSSAARRRGSENESMAGLRQGEDQVSKALTYRPSARERVPTSLDITRNRFQSGTSYSTPTTPKAAVSREISPESHISYGGRRPSVPDQALSSRTPTYRQSNLSYSASRTYNSSPLVSRTDNVQEVAETQRATEGTESSVSTTAPSTVWDELEDIKSRINRLELTGKLPATSGAAISRASQERPPTATTTVTTISSSPKRGRGNSISPVDSTRMETQVNDAHPLLSAALAKSKALLSPEVYSALEATAADALSISVMMGTSGQPGPISSSQSTIGGGSNIVSDRQVRRKADSMCRSLTELCLALSEVKSEQVLPNQDEERPKSRDTEPVHSADVTQRQPTLSDLARVKSSPRALSRLEARRSSLLATSNLPSPRYAPSDAGTPTQSSMAGRRTSLLLRNRRAGTEEPEEEDESRFRAPSRAITEVGRIRNSTREYTSQQPLPDRGVPTQSALPVRRHYASTSLTSTAPVVLPAVSNSNSRRYLDRATPERDTFVPAGKIAEDRTQRKSSIAVPLGRTGSLTRRLRQPSESQGGGYQQ
ncbi:hypothetical protein B0O99DRAFT_686681 [Bisporella sp. PMI_857]|nr:hypothetical protein B0O99DRAFT_686681 [Bisporella sp. PMI_857]